jgi:ABC-type multidrug transport system permease subunit
VRRTPLFLVDQDRTRPRWRRTTPSGSCCSTGRPRLPDAPALAVELRDRAWINPDLSSRNYNVPAVIGAIILLVSLLLTSLAIVREREIGTLEHSG